MLGRAFYDTEQWTAVVPDPDVRQRKLEQMFTGTMKLVRAAGGVSERTGGFEALGLWLPPGRSIGFGSMLRSGFASARFVLTPPFPSLRRLTGMLRQFERAHQQVIPDPHWYLMALGVDPAHQRHGFGSTLVRHGMQKADNDGVPVYHETETAANVGFFEQHGFEVIREITIEAYELAFSLMVRRPSP